MHQTMKTKEFFSYVDYIKNVLAHLKQTSSIKIVSGR